jgi:hypothetical protein
VYKAEKDRLDRDDAFSTLELQVCNRDDRLAALKLQMRNDAIVAEQERLEREQERLERDNLRLQIRDLQDKLGLGAQAG